MAPSPSRASRCIFWGAGSGDLCQKPQGVHRELGTVSSFGEAAQTRLDDDSKAPSSQEEIMLGCSH